MNSTLVGYAVLRANYNASSNTYVDNFSGFVLDALAEAHPRFLQKEQIAEDIRREFGIAIPDLVVGRLLRRMRKAGSADEVAKDCFQITEAGLSRAPAIRDLAHKYRVEQAELENRFRSFVSEFYEDHMSLLQGDVAQALQSYFGQHAVPLLAKGLTGRSLSLAHEAGFEYVISKFVTHLAENDSARFAYVVEASKGAILASVLELDTSGLADSLSSLALYFDTPLLINALGLQGEVLQRAALQGINLAKAQGAKVCVFEHSVRELHGVLDGVEKSLRAGSRSMSTSAVFLHLVETGISAADLAELQLQLDQRLKDLGLKIVDKPATYALFGLDESELETRLQDVVRYREASTRIFDVDSLSAIHRIREGGVSERFERSKAIFITSNSALVRAANQYVNDRNRFSLALHDGALAALLWVRSATMEDDVPREQLLATAYAGMQPSGYLWSKYIAEIEILQSRDRVTAEEAIMLRSTSVGRTAFMDETLGEDSEMSPELPIQILDRIRSDFERPLQEQMSELQSRQDQVAAAADSAASSWLEREDALTRTEQEVLDLRAEAERRDRRARERVDLQIAAVEEKAKRAAKRIVRIPLWIIFVALIVLAIGVGYASASGARSPIPGWFIAGGIAVLGALTFIQLFFPGSVLEWVSPLETKIQQTRARRELRELGLETRQESSVAPSS